MNLTLHSQCTAGVALIRCQGRIVVGKEVELLQQEVEKHHLETQKYVLQLAEVSYLDSGGLGALVRLVGMLRAHRGDLKLCEVAPFVQSVLKATNLLPVFSVYPTEREALASFAQGPSPREAHSWTANTALRRSVRRLARLHERYPQACWLRGKKYSLSCRCGDAYHGHEATRGNLWPGRAIRDASV
jgi:anti-sigma B factor antagonist